MCASCTLCLCFNPHHIRLTFLMMPSFFDYEDFLCAYEFRLPFLRIYVHMHKYLFGLSFQPMVISNSSAPYIWMIPKLHTWFWLSTKLIHGLSSAILNICALISDIYACMWDVILNFINRAYRIVARLHHV